MTPTMPKTDAYRELPDEIRVPLHEVWADLPLLFARSASEGHEAAILLAASQRIKLSAVEAALRAVQHTPADAQAPQADPAPSLDDVRREARREAFSKCAEIAEHQRRNSPPGPARQASRFIEDAIRAAAAADPVRGEDIIRNSRHSYLTPVDPFPVAETAADRRRLSGGGGE